MFRKMAGIVLALMLLGNSAAALEIETVQTHVPTDTTGAQMTLYRAHMDNGQEIYFLGEADGGRGKLEDVNFDGHADFVTFPTLGARNFFASFYVYQPETNRYEFAPVWNGQLCNYELDAEKKYVISQVSDGMRDGDTWIYRWADGHLEPLRRMHIAPYEEFVWTENGYTITHDNSRYEITIWDYVGNVNGDVIFEAVYPADETGKAESEQIAAAREVLFAQE